MAWTISLDPAAKKDLARMDKSVQRNIVHYLRTRITPSADPEAFGKALTGTLSGLRRYRVNDHRIICRIERQRIVVLVLAIGHRKDIYERIS